MSGPLVTVQDARGLGLTVSILGEFTPELKRALNRTLEEVATDVAAAAEQRLPSGHGRSGRNYKVKRSRAKIGYTAIATKRDSSIFEFAGKPGTFTKTPQGRGMIAWLNREHGSPGRFLWDSWDDLQGWELARMSGRVEELEAEYTARFARRL